MLVTLLAASVCAVAALLASPRAWRVVFRLCRPLIYLASAQLAHEAATTLGVWLTRARLPLALMRFGTRPPVTADALGGAAASAVCVRNIFGGRTLDSPVGLAAGFDYRGELSAVTHALGMSFHSVGTVTASACRGNSGVQLGRLLRSRALWVNKGLRNPGVRAVLAATPAEPPLALGLSVGPTNCAACAHADAQLDDMLESVHALLTAPLPLAYAYLELNISCPNNYGCNELSRPPVFETLLRRVADAFARVAPPGTAGRLPVYVKMPIDKPVDVVRQLLAVAAAYTPLVEGVIIGNLHTDHAHHDIDANEVARFRGGAFSGRACWHASNRLIELAYAEYGSRLTIIGCGGIMSAEDALHKITLGASAVQLISGLIFEGPSLVADINRQLPALLHARGFSSIADAVGSAVRRNEPSAALAAAACDAV